MKELDPDRTIVAIGGYGYDWVTQGTDPGADLRRGRACRRRTPEADIEFDPQTANPHFSFIEDDGNRHDVWFLGRCNGVQRDRSRGRLSHGRLCALAYRLRRSLGLVCPRPALTALRRQTRLRDIGTSRDIDFEAQGEVLHVREQPTSGARTFDIDHDTRDRSSTRPTRRVPTPSSLSATGTHRASLRSLFDDGPRSATGRRRSSIFWKE